MGSVLVGCLLGGCALLGSLPFARAASDRARIIVESVPPKDGWDIAVAFAQIASAGATVLLIWFTRQSLRISKRAAEIAEAAHTATQRMLQLTERGVLSFEKFSLGKDDDDTRLTLKLALKNTGNTPVRLTRIRHKYTEREPPEDPQYDDVAVGGDIFVAQGGVFRLQFATDPPNARMVASVFAGTTRVYFFGRIEYSDEFCQEHSLGYLVHTDKSEVIADLRPNYTFAT